VDKIKKQCLDLGTTLNKQEEVLNSHIKTIRHLKDENTRLRERNEHLNDHLRRDKLKSLSPNKK